MRETLPFGGHHIFDRLVARRLQAFYHRLAQRRPDARAILDIGCGPGHMAAALADSHPDGDVLGLDLDPVQVRLARRHHERSNLRYEEGASHDLPLADESLDWVLTSESYHHWSQQDTSLQEIHRVLKPGGECWIIEGAGDMTKDELAAWSGRRPLPGVIIWVRWVFTLHGYLPDALQREVLDRAEASPFEEVQVAREDGWWIVRLIKRG